MSAEALLELEPQAEPVEARKTGRAEAFQAAVAVVELEAPELRRIPGERARPAREPAALDGPGVEVDGGVARGELDGAEAAAGRERDRRRGQELPEVAVRTLVRARLAGQDPRRGGVPAGECPSPAAGAPMLTSVYSAESVKGP